MIDEVSCAVQRTETRASEKASSVLALCSSNRSQSNLHCSGTIGRFNSPYEIAIVNGDAARKASGDTKMANARATRRPKMKISLRPWSRKMDVAGQSRRRIIYLEKEKIKATREKVTAARRRRAACLRAHRSTIAPIAR